MKDDPIKNYVKLADRILHGLDAVLFVDIDEDLISKWNYNKYGFNELHGF